MRHAILVLAVAFAAGAAQARAELVTYYMTGTVIPLPPDYYAQSSLSVGDHVSWTFQYNNSTPLYDYSPGVKSVNLWNPTNPLITNIVDRTTGAGLFIPSTAPPANPGNPGWDSVLTLSSGVANGSSNFYASDGSFGSPPYPEGFYGSDIHLDINGLLPTFNLANLPLNKLPVNLTTSYFYYGYQYDMMGGDSTQFMASVDSISNPVYGAPEPGTLTLCFLGIVGLSACNMRRRLQVAMRS